MKKSIMSHAKSSLIPIFVIGLVFMSSALAYHTGVENGYSQTQNIAIEGVSNMQTPEDVKADFSVFWQAWSKLKEKHINGDKFDEQKAMEGAISGLADSFDDPYTVYFNPADSDKFNDDVRGSFGGVGMEIGIKNEQLIVVSPMKGTPAEAAGLKAGDMIVKIGDEASSSMKVDEAVKLIRGPEGTKVTLTIFREGWDKTQEFTITRAVIQVPTLEWKFKGNKIAHVQLYSFNENANQLFAVAVKKILEGGARGMVLDLRNNPGGYLQVSVDLAGWFLPPKTEVVSEEFSSGSTNVFRARGNAMLKDFPVVVLINEGSASASEILAGALKDQRNIKLVGMKSFGKGTVQEVVTLKDGSTLKITIAKWLTPDGTTIDKNGITPDYKVEIPDSWKKGDPDPQLNKALEVLETQIKK